MHRLVGIVLGVLLVLSGVWFWSHLPGRDLTRIAAISSQSDLVGLLLSTFVFGTLLVIVCIIIVNSIFGDLDFRILGGVVGVGVVGVAVDIILSYSKYQSQNLFRFIGGSAALTLATLWLAPYIIDIVTPPTPAEQIAQLQTWIASTATSAPLQTMTAEAWAAATSTANMELTRLSELAATLNRPTPTPLPTSTPAPSLTPVLD